MKSLVRTLRPAILVLFVSACQDGSGPSTTPFPTQPTPQPPPVTMPCVPELLSPPDEAILDNGRASSDGSAASTDGITWEFDWSDCPNATEYELHVIGRTATIPLVPFQDQYPITGSSFRYATCDGYIADMNRLGWRWRVRASIGGVWGPWSAERIFNVEPVNTDPPSGCE